MRDAEEERLRDEMFAELDAIKARAGEGDEFFAAMARHTAKLKAHHDLIFFHLPKEDPK